MLPRFRFIFAASILSLSLVIFGLGAAGLLRSTHGKYVSQSIRRAELSYYPPQQTFPMPTAAMLRVDDIAPPTIIAPPNEMIAQHPVETPPEVTTVGASHIATADEPTSDHASLAPHTSDEHVVQAAPDDDANLTVTSLPELEHLPTESAQEPAAIQEPAQHPANDVALPVDETIVPAPVIVAEPAPVAAEVAETVTEPAAPEAAPASVAAAPDVAVATSDVEPADTVIETSVAEVKLADIRLPADRPTSAPSRVALATADTNIAETSTPAPAVSPVVTTIDPSLSPEQTAIAEQNDIALSAEEVRLPVSRPKPETAAKKKPKPRKRVAAQQEAAPPQPATYRAETINFGALLR